MTRADTIARHLSVFETHLRGVACGFSAEERLSSASDAAAALREAFAALDGGAAVAGEANGPPEPAPPDEEPSAEVLAADDSQDEPADSCARCGQERAHLLHAPISPGALCHGVGPLRDVYAHPFVAAAPTPSPPKPAGWVVRDDDLNDRRPFNGRLGWHATVAEAGPFETRTEAEAVAKRAVHVHVVPVDAAGNVIEALPGVAWEAARAGEEAERLRTELAAVKAERDALNAAEADLRHALRQIAELVGGAVSLGASTDMHCAVANEVRVVVADLRAERDALAAEVQRAREQKPVRWAVVLATGHVASVWHEPDIAAEVAATVAGRRVAPLYLAPVVRDHSGVIAQCEEALREWDRKGPHCSATSSLVAVTLTKARNALRGAS